jgi:hypothetical protein
MQFRHGIGLHPRNNNGDHPLPGILDFGKSELEEGPLSFPGNVAFPQCNRIRTEANISKQTTENTSARSVINTIIFKT